MLIKIVFISLLLSTFQAFAQNGVFCQLKDLSNCTDCQKRVPASCEDNKFMGSLELNLKPQKIHWLVSNSSNGMDRILTTENFNLDLQGILKAQTDYTAFLKKQKVAVQKSEKVYLTGVLVRNETALYKNQQGTNVVAKLSANPKRNIASDAPAYQIGGIRRALKVQSKESK